MNPWLSFNHLKIKMEKAEMQNGRRKTGLPSQLASAAEEKKGPNIIQNVENSTMMVKSNPFIPKERVTVRDLEQHAQTKDELYNLLTV